MSSRMEKYNNQVDIPSRSHKNKELYKQIYNAYDEFENLIVPSNAREINPQDLRKEIISRQEYKKQKDYDIVNNTTNNTVIRKEKILEEQKQEDDIYDINELLIKAKAEKKKPDLIEPSLANEDYLKKLKLDNRRTNIEQVKEMYDDIREEASDEDEALMKTANLSLEILSDLKGDSEKTMVSAPIKNEELPDNNKDNDFYSNTYKFSKRDFEGHDFEEPEDEEDDEEESYEEGNGKFFFKILLLIFGLLLIGFMLIYFINYFGKV